MGNKKLQVWLPLIFSMVMIAGMFFGFNLHKQTGSNKGFFAVNKRNSLEEALDLIKLRYVDSVHMDTLEEGAIQQMMSGLDPHSVYIPASSLKEVNEDIAGAFEGIGVEFNIFYDTVHVLYVLPGGPSEKGGLKVADRILKVNDEIIVGKTITSDHVKKLIRGPINTKVDLTILRNNQQMNVSILRGSIPVPSMDAAYMIDKNTGYIKLNKFSENTYKEFMQAMEKLKGQGLKKLVLDLRGNGGGLMSEAVEIADEFLDDDKLIVYTEGANTQKHEYSARRHGVFENGKLVVLVDELSASASEIVSGALQDWDRATIVGRRTFGKGLVQEQYELSDGSAIRLTVARYYTPVGRSIQRSYDKGKKVYMDEIWQRYRNGELLHADSNKINKGQIYKTFIEKRPVYGGGGIMPDVFVPIDTNYIQHNVTKLYLETTFNNFVYNYYVANLSRFNQYRSATEFAQKFTGINDAWSQLVNYALRDTIYLKNIPPKDQEGIKESLKAYLARYKWRTEGFFEVLNMNDIAVKKALEVLNE
ncbi:MAG TPA: S41 family peptidase [Chitinophagaceae bacterium]|jgi:carboxyl-terminal processing protease|nr:S41 family peptidase [Chitinophagaceae bacterium]